MYGDPDAMLRFQLKRRSHKNLVSGSLQFLYWGATEPVRAFSYMLGKQNAAAPVPVAVPAPVAVETVPEMLATTAPTLAEIAPDVAADSPVVVTTVPVLSIVPDAAAETIVAPVVEEDFEALAASLSAAPVDAPIVAAEWMQAMLKLAAVEMQRALSPATADPAETSLAA